MLFGPNEFQADSSDYAHTEASRSDARAANVLAAYKSMQPQGVYLSQAAQSWFAQHRQRVPQAFVPVGDEPQTRVYDSAGKKIGVVYFPRLKAAASAGQNGGTPLDISQAARRVLEAGEKLRPKVDLLIGISPWGIDAEQAFVPLSSNLYDIILGGGRGYGFPSASFSSMDLNGYAPLWSRPIGRGTALNIIRVYTWPKPGKGKTGAGDYQSEQTRLTASVPEQTDIARMFPAE